MDSLPEPPPDFDAASDRTRLEELCRRHYPRVEQLVHQMLANDVRRGRPWLASVLSTGDVVQEVFLGVVRDFDGFRGDEPAFVAYLARLVRNRLVDSLRHHEALRRDPRRNAAGIDLVLSEARSPYSRASADEDAELFHQVLAEVKERDRALLRGRIEDGESFQQLADALGYASADSARKAFCAIQAKLLTKLPSVRRSS